MDHQHGLQNPEESSIDNIYKRLGSIFQVLPPDRQAKFRQDILHEQETADRAANTTGIKPGKGHIRLVEHD